jgi:hypothetical protein
LATVRLVTVGQLTAAVLLTLFTLLLLSLEP